MLHELRIKNQCISPLWRHSFGTCPSKHYWQTPKCSVVGIGRKWDMWIVSGRMRNECTPCMPFPQSWPVYILTTHKRKVKNKTQRDAFNFNIVNFPFISSDISEAQACGVYISQLIAKSAQTMLRSSYVEFIGTKIQCPSWRTDRSTITTYPSSQMMVKQKV